jgi:hypothetical protein
MANIHRIGDLNEERDQARNRPGSVQEIHSTTEMIRRCEELRVPFYCTPFS